jgi:hypothetical protein
VPGSGGVAHRTPVDLPTKRLAVAPLGLLAALALLAAWLLVAPRTPDLAAAAYRVDLFKHLGLAIYDEHWYAGHDLPGYSVLFPPLAWLLGLRVAGALCVLVSVACFERLTSAVYGSAARWGAIAFAVAAVGDVWIGRMAFALGVSFALATALAFVRGRGLLAGVLAVLCAAASPVAGVLLALAALTDSLWRRSPRALLVLAAPALVVVLALGGLFPEGGSEPYPIISFAATAVVVVAFVLALPREHGLLRLGGAIYLFVCLVFLLAPSAMGSNIERYGVLLAGPLLACVVLSERAEGRDAASERHASPSEASGGAVSAGGTSARAADGDRALGREANGSVRPGSRTPWRVPPVAVLALAVWALWVVWGPVRETLAVAGNASTDAAYYTPVERFLEQHAGTPVRLEVPLTRSHWETAELAPRVSLARGWEKQLDTRFDGVLLRPGLTAASYGRWLHRQAVAYVALPDTQLDPSSAREGDLIRAGLPYLREVFVSRHWRIYAVRAPTPLVSGGARLTTLGHESFDLSVPAAGSYVVRVRFTRYWTLARGSGCVGQASGGWTRVVAHRPGPLLVRTSFSLARALGLGASCRAG